MKISVITVTYNSANTLRDTFESMLAQTYDDIEYIVVDGGSTDGTMELVKAYAPKFSGRMKWISEKDKGIYDAMNKGIRMAMGDVVGILNSDDFFSANDVIETIAYTMQEKNIDAIYADIHYVNEGKLDKCVRYYSSRYFRPWAMHLGFIPAHPSFYARKQVFEKYGYYNLDYKISSDFDMLLRLLYIHRIKTQYINKDFVTMRQGGASTRNLNNRSKVQKEIARSLKHHGVYYNQLLFCLRYAWKLGEYAYSKFKF